VRRFEPLLDEIRPRDPTQATRAVAREYQRRPPQWARWLAARAARVN